MNKLVVFACTHSAQVARQELEAGGYELPAHVEWVTVSCGGSIDTIHILRAFESGAQRVMVLVCYDGACNSSDGSKWAAKRVAAAQGLLKEAGLDPARVTLHQMAPPMAADLRAWLAACQPEVTSEPA